MIRPPEDSMIQSKAEMNSTGIRMPIRRRSHPIPGAFRMAFQSTRENWKRSILSGLGVLIGTAAILLLVSIAKGVRDDLSNQVRELGVNVLVVIPGRLDDGSFNPNLGGFSYMREEDAINLRKIPGVVRADPFTFIGGGMTYKGKSATPLLAAAMPDWFQMRPVVMEEGRVFTTADENTDVAVLGSIAKTQLFGSDTAIGKKVEINQHEYTVIGVTEDKKEDKSLLSAFSLQNVVYLPYPREKKLVPDLQTARIMIQIAPEAEPKRLIKLLEASLGKRLSHEQFQVLTQEQILGLVYKLTGILTWLLTGLTSIGLVVGGVGIMSIMLLSVNERVTEIGVRTAVGARRKDIFWQFVFESTLISFFGGVGGLALSLFVCRLLAAFTPIHPLLTAGVGALGIGFSGVVGVVFGAWPAAKASKLDPAVALRD